MNNIKAMYKKIKTKIRTNSSRVIITYQLTQAKGFKQSMDINSHLLCFDHTAGQRECIPFWQSKNDLVRLSK